MSNTDKLQGKQMHFEEITPKSMNGMIVLILNILLMLASIAGVIFGIIRVSVQGNGAGTALIVISALYFLLIGPILFSGLKILKPNEALVLTLFGKYHGTLKGEGFFFVNPFVTAFNPTAESAAGSSINLDSMNTAGKNVPTPAKKPSKIISLKTMTLDNEKQKINDELGNPIIIGIVVIWRVVNTAKAAFNVDNYKEYLSIQCDSALRNIVRLYPYDSTNEDQCQYCS